MSVASTPWPMGQEYADDQPANDQGGKQVTSAELDEDGSSYYSDDEDSCLMPWEIGFPHSGGSTASSWSPYPMAGSYSADPEPAKQPQRQRKRARWQAQLFHSREESAAAERALGGPNPVSPVMASVVMPKRARSISVCSTQSSEEGESINTAVSDAGSSSMQGC